MSLSERRAAQLVTALDSVVRTVRYVAAKDHGQTMTGTLSGILKAVSTTDLRSGDLAAHLMVAPSVASRAVAALEPGIEPILQWKEMRPKHRFWRTDEVMMAAFGNPIDPEGHLCVRANGFRRRDP